eukprot:m.27634 g.27634  ORF g.27634 m.27634 type:complete len:142 (+) comp30229_c0_seq2:127-552(+)
MGDSIKCQQSAEFSENEVASKDPGVLACSLYSDCGLRCKINATDKFSKLKASISSPLLRCRAHQVDFYRAFLPASITYANSAVHPYLYAHLHGRRRGSGKQPEPPVSLVDAAAATSSGIETASPNGCEHNHVECSEHSKWG